MTFISIHTMTFIINISFRNLNACYLSLILFLLLAGAQGKTVWIRDVNENCTDPLPPENAEHKENSEIASLIAQKAAQEAMEASNAQNEAGAEAALEVKEELAQRAEDAARAAQAALAGKQAVVDELERQINDDEQMIQEQSEAQRRIEDAAKTANQAAAEMDNLSAALQKAIQSAQQASTGSKCAAKVIQEESDSKCQLIKVARARLAQLVEELKKAQIDLNKTMEAAKKAVSSAKAAEGNAIRHKRTERQKDRRRNKFK